jgi:hypothetical protein
MRVRRARGATGAMGANRSKWEERGVHKSGSTGGRRAERRVLEASVWMSSRRRFRLAVGGFFFSRTRRDVLEKTHRRPRAQAPMIHDVHTAMSKAAARRRAMGGRLWHDARWPALGYWSVFRRRAGC